MIPSSGLGTPFSSRSPQGDALRSLILVTIWLVSAIALLVTALVTYAVVRYRDRGTGIEPKQTGGNRKVEIAYTVIPLGIQCALFGFTVFTMHRAEPQETNRPADLVITAHQWWWELRYPDGQVSSANEIHLPVGKATLIELRSADVIHEMWVPQLGPKMDTVPGKPNRLVIQPERVGNYLGNCAEFCGVGHAWMRLLVVVQSPEDFAAWERQQAKPGASASGAGVRGEQTFQNETCIQCHAIDGLSTANVGPNLTHFGSRATLGAGVADNTPDELRRWLHDPQAMKPSCYMPNMRLSDSQVSDLAAYLEALK